MNESSILRGDLLETLRWSPAERYFLLERHLARMLRSGAALGWRLDAARLRECLERAARTFPVEACRVRLRVTRQGIPDVAAVPLADCPLPRPMRVALAARPVRAADPVLQHKMTDRRLYEQARQAGPAGVDDVLLWNERGELTESTLANVVLELGARRVTPVLASGLLPGVFREELLDRGEIVEDVVPLAALETAGALFLINSVREWMPAVFCKGPGAAVHVSVSAPSR